MESKIIPSDSHAGIGTHSLSMSSLLKVPAELMLEETKLCLYMPFKSKELLQNIYAGVLHCFLFR